MPEFLVFDDEPALASAVSRDLILYALERREVLGQIDAGESDIRQIRVAGPSTTPLVVALTSSGEVRRWLPGDGRAMPDLPELSDVEVVRIATGERSLLVVPERGPMLLFDATSDQPVARPLVVVGPDGQPVEIMMAAVADEAGCTATAAIGTDRRLYTAATGEVSRWRQPNPSVARDYWTAEDHLGFEAYSRAIGQFIEHADTRPPLTIGIKRGLGSGEDVGHADGAANP